VQAKGLNGENSDEDEPSEVKVTARQGSNKRRKSGPQGKGRDWVFKKKDQMRKRGYDGIPSDSKYTGRKRKAGF
jgi:18S rRNA (guanine1575-N7)-methyltransferase